MGSIADSMYNQYLDFDFEPDDSGPRKISCKYCGEGNLKLINYGGSFGLATIDSNRAHNCEKHPSNIKDEDIIDMFYNLDNK